MAFGAPSLAAADAIDPITMVVTAPAAVKPGAPIAVSVVVNADPGALDPRAGAIHLGVRLAAECGGSYATTPSASTAIPNSVLSPQPAAGAAYRATAKGSTSASGNGDLTVCTYLTDDEGRQFATDTDTVVEVNATGTPSGGGGSGTGGAGGGSGTCTPTVAAAARTAVHHRGRGRALTINYRACAKGRYRFVLERGARRVRTKTTKITRTGRRTTKLALGRRGVAPGTYKLVVVLPSGRHLRATRSVRVTR
jgi:hypothetical protein